MEGCLAEAGSVADVRVREVDSVEPRVGRRESQAAAPGKAAWWDGWACALLTLVAFLAARPYVEMGLVDDFSYVKTAWVFAHTGKLVYNGWATAMLGWQIPFAAPFIRVLGDTFLAARLPITVLLVLSVVVIHAVMLRAGLTRERAALGALVVGMSPLTLPMAATFMTDIAGMFVIVVCLYCAMRALRAEADSSVLGWLLAGFVVGAAGGTARQIAWMAALVMMPSAGWLLRRRRGVVVLSVAMWVVSLLVMFGSLHWFKQQPFHVPEPLRQGPLHVKLLRELWGTMTAAALCLALLVLPLLSEGFRVAVRRFSAGLWAGIAAVSVVATWFFKWVTFHLVERGFLPWTGDIVGRMDIFDSPNLWLLGVTPITWNHAARAAGSVVVVFAVFVFVVAMTRSERVGASASQRISKPAKGGPLTWWELAVVLVPFCCAYIVLLSPRGMWAQILDRYLLPLMVIAALPLLRLCQERVSVRPGKLPWVLLVVFTLWTVAGLHDWIEGHRARLEAVARLHAAGIGDTQLNAGYEYDGMTQIQLAGAVVDPRVTYPAGFDQTIHYAPGLPGQCKLLYQEHSPVIHPEYFLAYDPEPCTVVSPFGDVTYRRWLPPFEGRIHIYKLRY